MTVAVLGPGAVGGVLTVGFVEAGVRVVCIARPETAAVLWAEGLSVNDRAVWPVATTELPARPSRSQRCWQPG